MRTSAIWWGPIWLVLVAVAVPTFGSDAATLLLAGGLVVIAGARWVWRRERPEGLAVRSWPIDVALSLALAIGITALTLR
ncbi:DUF3017 domain-containing protein [Actinotalea sp. M2MS4P-6]|uniref:DUF3017 domain-containing protein n=1 Tax=Actinotalea sp. M2MS4P-6 TaxID=2983762 RepID=UPI0021E3628C|nr:DUF3017 domain-containing protein [Actinotalea sp. M2MS4P-6]MCV2395458.1 DUF3017 domain-containing protein [Actinotalea sp. M2MS4P-6]